MATAEIAGCQGHCPAHLCRPLLEQLACQISVYDAPSTLYCRHLNVSCLKRTENSTCRPSIELCLMMHLEAACLRLLYSLNALNHVSMVLVKAIDESDHAVAVLPVVEAVVAC